MIAVMLFTSMGDGVGYVVRDIRSPEDAMGCVRTYIEQLHGAEAGDELLCNDTSIVYYDSDAWGPKLPLHLLESADQVIFLNDRGQEIEAP
jgi:hypothetical protein